VPVIRPVTMLTGVGVVLVILLAPYVRPWLAQRSDIAAKRAEVAALEQRVNQLSEEREQWQDPDFVKAQARQRLNFVMPGEYGYVVLDHKATATVDPTRQAALDAGRLTGRPWYDVLWQSMQLAGGSSAAATGSAGGTASTGAPATTGTP
jgi:hypothetical protein